jgi:cell division protein FtsI/penicillin-binding protein 2
LPLFKRKKPTTRQLDRPDWRAYQERLRRQYMPARRNRRRTPRDPGRYRGLALAALAVLFLAGGYRVFFSGPREEAPAPARHAAAAAAPAGSGMLIEKKDVRILLGGTPLVNLKDHVVQVTFDGSPYRLTTSLNLDLQQYLLDKMDRVNSRYIGIVAMEPDTGRILAMAGFNKIDPQQDPCLTADYPAASLFKIVTAAAAVETKGYGAGTRLKFNGYKHTLYKRQLTDKTNRYTSAISLKDAFAQSVNPVFGKIGALYLDREALEVYGNAFGFNRDVNFELPWPTSRLAIKDDTYRRAEIASGFNRQTTISPLHGAVIVSAVVNGGKPIEPTLVDRITDKAGHPVYETRPRFMEAAVSAHTAKVLRQLMTATVTSGTARKAFLGYSRSKVLSRLKLGGKTGSIFNRPHDARFDWYVGYATEKKGHEKMVVAVVVAHEEYIGTRAGQYARMAIEHYFKDYFARQKENGEDSSG